MDKRLRAKVDEIVTFAEQNGWECATDETTGTVEGCTDVILVGGRFGVRHPDHVIPDVDFVFTMGFGVNDQTGRVVTLRQQDEHDAAIVLIVEDGSGRYWWSKTASQWKQALADPIAWCNYELAASR